MQVNTLKAVFIHIASDDDGASHPIGEGLKQIISMSSGTLFPAQVANTVDLVSVRATEKSSGCRK